VILLRFGFIEQLRSVLKRLRWFFGASNKSGYEKVRLPSGAARSDADNGNVQRRAGLAGHASDPQSGAQRTRYRVGDSLGLRGGSGGGSGDEALESIPESIPTCGLRGAERFSTAAESTIAFRRIAPLPDGVPLPSGLYEWFDSDWSDVFVACPINWASEHRPLSVVDLTAKRVLWQVWEPYFTPELARQAANMAVQLVELGRKDATSEFRSYKRL
jgi:hypothetical protein